MNIPNTKYKVELRDEMSERIVKEIWETNIYRITEVPDNAVVIDIGGHAGLFSMNIAHRNRTAKIYLYEPDKKNYELLLLNLKNNGFDQVKTFNLAVANKEGSRRFKTDGGLHSGAYYLTERGNEKVETTTLTKIFEDNKIEKCDIIKLDCEGAELEILETTSDEVLEKIDYITISTHCCLTENEQIFTRLMALLTKLNKTFIVSYFGLPTRGFYIYGKRRIT